MKTVDQIPPMQSMFRRIPPLMINPEYMDGMMPEEISRMYECIILGYQMQLEKQQAEAVPDFVATLQATLGQVLQMGNEELATELSSAANMLQDNMPLLLETAQYFRAATTRLNPDIAGHESRMTAQLEMLRFLLERIALMGEEDFEDLYHILFLSKDETAGECDNSAGHAKIVKMTPENAN